MTLKGQIIAEVVAGNPQGRLKAVEYDQYGALRRVEWYDDQEQAEFEREDAEVRALSEEDDHATR